MITKPRIIYICPVSSSWSFIVLHFIFMFVIHGCKVCLDSLFCMWVSSCFSTIFWKDCFFHCITFTFVPLSNITWLFLCGPISGLSIMFHWCIGSSSASTTQCSFLGGLEVRYCPSSNFVFLQYHFGYSGSFFSMQTLKSVWQYPQNNLMGFWFRLY